MQTMWAELARREVSMDSQQEFQKFYQENLALIYRYVYSQVGTEKRPRISHRKFFSKYSAALIKSVAGPVCKNGSISLRAQR